MNIQLDDPERIIWQNNSGHATFSKNSFVNILHEREIWNDEAYQTLEKALLGVAKKYQEKPLPRDLMLAIFDVYDYVFGRLCWHQIPSDGSTIENLSDDECHQRWERLNYVVRGALGGYPLKDDVV